MNATSRPCHLSRRSALKGLAAAIAAGAAPAFVPSAALGRDGAVAASERIVMGGIGMGHRAQHDLSILLHEKDVRFVAFADVSRDRRRIIKKMVDDHYGNADCVAYRDLREFLAGRAASLDAVLIATGDRWHTPAAILAMKAGLDIFCEKPSTMTVAEGQALVATARRYGRVFQTGTQRLSEAKFVFADELARSGRLGKVHTVYAHILPFAMWTHHLPAQPEPDREVFDWDLWLGPAPRRAYNRGYIDGCGAWLDYYDFGTGVAGWGSHTICQCMSAMGDLTASALTYHYPGKEDGDGLVCTYANGVKLVLDAQGWPKEGVPGKWRGSCGVRYEGTEGWVAMADGYSNLDVSSPALLAEYDKVMAEYFRREQRPMHHIRDFLDCVKSRREPIANALVAHRSMTTNHAANACMLLKRDLTWDPVNERFVNDPEADRFLTRALRAPWTI